MRLLVTGGCGFAGSAFLRLVMTQPAVQALNVDNLTYAGNPAAVASLENNSRYCFLRADIADTNAMQAAIAEFRPDAVVNFAAETHVDRSIDSAQPFLHTNVIGTHCLLEAATEYWRQLPSTERDRFRYLQVSTDEVYGDREGLPPATTASAYRPSSPYAAAKAAGDHLALAWMRTYGLPVLITHGSNNYGPGQFPEKLVPRFLSLALAGGRLPLYGDGLQRRDWIYVEDHASGVLAALESGVPGQEYLLSCDRPITNLELVRELCSRLDTLKPRPGKVSHFELVDHVPDRPGHDRCYSMDGAACRAALRWQPTVSLDEGLSRTVAWHVAH